MGSWKTMHRKLPWPARVAAPMRVTVRSGGLADGFRAASNEKAARGRPFSWSETLPTSRMRARIHRFTRHAAGMLQPLVVRLGLARERRRLGPGRRRGLRVVV